MKGIGVDTHVHRISNRLRWVKTDTAEDTVRRCGAHTRALTTRRAAQATRGVAAVRAVDADQQDGALADSAVCVGTSLTGAYLHAARGLRADDMQTRGSQVRSVSPL